MESPLQEVVDGYFLCKPLPNCPFQYLGGWGCFRPLVYNTLPFEFTQNTWDDSVIQLYSVNIHPTSHTSRCVPLPPSNQEISIHNLLQWWFHWVPNPQTYFTFMLTSPVTKYQKTMVPHQIAHFFFSSPIIHSLVSLIFTPILVSQPPFTSEVLPKSLSIVSGISVSPSPSS